MREALTPMVWALFAGIALAAPAPQRVDESQYLGSKACEECHRQNYLKWESTKMAKVFLGASRSALESRGCEACHGPGREHVEKERDRDRARASGIPYAGPKSSEFIVRFGKDSPLAAKAQNTLCLQCHEKGQRLFWKGSAHESRGLTCATCHQMHKKEEAIAGATFFKEPLSDNRLFVKSTQMEVCFQCHQMRRAQLQRSSHMPFREGKVTCTNCHNPHGTPNPKLLIEASVNETCYKCHAERRGPFLWEHPPVMENCLNCHDPHGSGHPQLLKATAPRLCQRCHVQSFHPSTPQLATARFVFNRGCLNCHAQIHGSNHPSGVRFHR